MTDLLEREITACTAACPARHAASVVEKKKEKKKKSRKNVATRLKDRIPPRLR